jgi:hypothetical protein
VKTETLKTETLKRSQEDIASLMPANLDALPQRELTNCSFES